MLYLSIKFLEDGNALNPEIRETEKVTFDA